MAVTILDIAKVSGKSYPTVSRALNDNPKISLKTRKHIREIADELGYRPSLAGKTLKSGKTNILSVIVPDLADPFYSEFISQFRRNGAQHGFDTVVYDYELDPKHEQQCLERILSGYCDGAVAFISGFAHTGEIVRKLWNARIPLAAVGAPHEFDKGLKYDLITSKYEVSLSQILGIMKQQKRKRVVFAASKITDRAAVFLNRILKDKFQAAGFGFGVDNFVQLPKSFGNQAEDGLQLGRKIFAESPEADVVIVWNSFQAYGLILAAREAGKRIPDDVAVVVRDNTWVSKYATVPLFSIDQRLDLMAQECFKRIAKRLESEQWEEPVRIEIDSETICPESLKNFK